MTNEEIRRFKEDMDELVRKHIRRLEMIDRDYLTGIFILSLVFFSFGVIGFIARLGVFGGAP